MRLVIVSHALHYSFDGQLYGYGPYAREIDIWADLFSEVVIAAPCRNEPPPGDWLRFTRTNISVAAQKEAGGQGLPAKIHLILNLPLLIWWLCREMRRADAIHVRCPGNLGLLGAILAPLFCTRLVAKYAGQWGPYPGEAMSYWLQRTILRSRWWRGPVTVYGRDEGDPDHVISFFTAILTNGHLERARIASVQKTANNPIRVLYVGRLSASKNVDAMLAAIARVRERGGQVVGTVVGQGPERRNLEILRERLNLTGSVELVGAVPFEKVLFYFEQSDVLVLTSETEGWPKAIVEAMAFGLVCIGSRRGLVPEILGNGRGLVVEPRDVDALADKLREIVLHPEAFDPMRERASKWARQYSLEGLRDALGLLLANEWKIPLRPVSEPVQPRPEGASI